MEDPAVIYIWVAWSAKAMEIFQMQLALEEQLLLAPEVEEETEDKEVLEELQEVAEERMVKEVREVMEERQGQFLLAEP